MKCRNFIYVGEFASQITEQEHTAFYFHVQKSILASLEKRELLTHSHYVRCINQERKMQKIKKRVAAYCRVSTDNEDQANSFESQQRYFRQYIECNPNWELYGIFAEV